MKARAPFAFFWNCILVEQGRTQGEFGVKTPLELDILRKLYYLRKGD